MQETHVTAILSWVHLGIEAQEVLLEVGYPVGGADGDLEDLVSADKGC